jgi:hypothetical protein
MTVYIVRGAVNADVPSLERVSEGSGWHVQLPSSLYLQPYVETVLIVCGGAQSSCLVDYSMSHYVGQPASVRALEDYTVLKPWGTEQWLTENLNSSYGLKLIHINAGQRSSLQYHREKVETCYVVDGLVKHFFGISASEYDPNQGVADLRALDIDYMRGWTVWPREIHRFQAVTAARILEISTPQLDDVVRLADDCNRGDGRIVAEHLPRRPEGDSDLGKISKSV